MGEVAAQELHSPDNDAAGAERWATPRRDRLKQLPVAQPMTV